MNRQTTPAAPDVAYGTFPHNPAELVDINDAIVRYVAIYQPCNFTELVEFFTELPADGPMNSAHLLALRQRLTYLCATGRLTHMSPTRVGARGYGPRRARYILAAGIPSPVIGSNAASAPARAPARVPFPTHHQPE